MSRSQLVKRVFVSVAGCAAVLAALGAWSPWQVAGTAVAGAGSGTISGTVTYKGKPPARQALDRGTDPVCASKPTLSEKIVVTGGKLRDVHVGIAAGAAGKHAAPGAPVMVDQLECMYRPRVVGVMQGQKLAVRNSDPTYHNVRGTKHEHTEWNLGQPASAPDIVREALGKPGEVVTLRCDIHPWMRAYAVITDHPFFDVTGDDGAFTVKNVPPGRYTLEAWHPELGRKKVEVVVEAGKTAQASFAFP